MIPQGKVAESLTDSMIGIFKDGEVDDYEAELEKALEEKYNIDD